MWCDMSAAEVAVLDIEVAAGAVLGMLSLLYAHKNFKVNMLQ